MKTRLTLEPRRDDRAIAYVVALATAVLGALLTGRVEVIAFGAPFAVALVMSRSSDPVVVELSYELDTTRVVEGDELAGRLVVTGDDARLDRSTIEVLMNPSPDLEPVAPTDRVVGWEQLGHGRSDFAVRPKRWGRYVYGPTSVRVRDPWSTTYYEATAKRGPAIVVLPSAPRLDRILEPRSSRTMAGSHLSRRAIGPGVDFAELQDYRPGDRLRDLNRSASARVAQPIVNRYHPERSGDVVVLLDTFIDSGQELNLGARAGLVIGARAAWAVARAHLSAQDRVGIALVGRIPVWLPPDAGARARYAILDALLSASAALDGMRFAAQPVDPGKVPPAALVVFISPLWTDRYLTLIERLQARGRETAVLQLRSDDLLGPSASHEETLARRLFELDVADRADTLRRAGIGVVNWSASASLGASVNALAQLQLRRRSARIQ